jgi:Ca2+-binding RTX toxin-like protein
MDETIEVRYKRISEDSQFYHKYIIYTNSSGDKWYARGGPEWGGIFSGGISDQVPTSYEGFGSIEAVWGIYEEGSVDWDDQNEHDSEEIARDVNLLAQWELIIDAVEGINEGDYQYNPVAQNSNAFVDYALAEAGLPPAQQDDPGEHNTPGSDSPFLFEVPLFMPRLPDWVPDVLGPFDGAKPLGSPLIVDLDGDGVEATTFNPETTDTFFDLNNDGFAEQTAWVGAHDGLLVRDLDESGTIDNATELFGSTTVDGFALLAELDSNGDLFIDANDETWNDLLIWKDADGDAITDGGELQTLAYHNITSISLAGVTSSTSAVGGNPISHTSTVTKSGSSAAIADVWFVHEHMNTVRQGDYEIDHRVLFMPTLRGFGWLPDLHVAMSENEDLLDLVLAFATDASFESFGDAAALDAAVEEILFTWAGVEGVDPGSRGPFVDARQLAFLERLIGENWVQQGWSPEPGGYAADYLNAAYGVALAELKSNLLMQTAVKGLFESSAAYYLYEGDVVGTPELDEAAVGNLTGYATDPGVNEEDYWTAVAAFIHRVKDLDTLSVDEEEWLDDAIYASDNALNWADIRDDYLASLTAHEYYNEINGTSGNDTLNGTVLHDQIAGGDGNDTITGLGGNDKLYGSGGNDTITPGDGGDRVEGGTGADTYIYTSGNDLYTEPLWATDADVIKLPSGIDSTDLTFARLGNYDLLITVDTLGTIQIAQQFGIQKIETIEFYDTSTFNLLTLNNLELHGTNGVDDLDGLDGSSNDLLYGYGGDDSIEAGSGNDTVDGGAGNDYINLGPGNDVIIASPGYDTVAPLDGTDTLLIPVGYDMSDVEFIRVNNGEKLVISIAGLGQVDFAAQFFAGSNQLEYLQFASGGDPVALSTIVITAVGTAGNDGIVGVDTGASPDDMMYGLAGNDTLYGYTGNDTMDGGAGNDVLYGYAGNDTYIFSTGTDQAFDSTNGTDRVLFSGTYDPESVSVYRSESAYGGTSSLVIDDGAGNTLTVYGHFSYDSSFAWAVETIEFEGGPTWTVANLEIPTYGNASNNTIAGIDGAGSVHDTIFGYAGNDWLFGYAGNDQLFGGAGYDQLIGGDGSDTANYSLDPAAVTVNLTTGSATDGDAYTDTLTTIENAVGSAYNDTLTGSSDVNELRGGNGNDTINGEAGDDSLYGDAGNDLLAGNEDDDTLFGGGGDDEYAYSAGDGEDTITDDSGTDDFIRLGPSIVLADIILTQVGDDLEITFDGAAGDKITVVDHYAAGTKQVEKIVFDDESELSLIANLIEGTGASETINGTTGIDHIYGYGGNDTLYGLAGDDELYGGDGNDILHPGTGQDVLDGGAGAFDIASYENNASGVTVNLATSSVDKNGDASPDDALVNIERVVGSGYADTMYAHATGNAYLHGQGGNDTLYGYAGADYLEGWTGNDTIYGGDGNDTLRGYTGDDSLYGQGGNDTLVGQSGSDYLDGGSGIDRVDYSIVSQAVYVNLALGFTDVGRNGSNDHTLVSIENATGDSDDDLFVGDASQNKFWGQNGADVMYGGDGNDQLWGENNNDTLYGEDGDDNLRGQNDNDTLYGGEGVDLLYGGSGADVFVFEFASVFAGDDTIADFSTAQSDAIDLADVLDFDPMYDDITDFVQITDSGSDSLLAVDWDGGGNNFIQVATISGVTGLTDEAALVSSGHLIAA